MKTTRLSALLLSLLLLLSACGTKRQDTPDPDPAPDPAPVTPQPVEKTPDERIDDIIADMSLEEKVGQLFFVRAPKRALRRTSLPITSAAFCSSGGIIRTQAANGSPRTTLPPRSRRIKLRRRSRCSSAATKRAAPSPARAGTPTSSPRRFPPRRRSMPRSAWRECSPKRAATTKRSKPSAST